MKTSTSRWSGLAMLLAVCGCDPPVEILGTVVAADGGIAPPTRVDLTCTGGAQRSVPGSVQTDSLGRFALRGVGCLPPECVLSTGEGIRRVEQHLMEWCKKSAPGCAPGTCSAASVTLTLPDPPKTAGPRGVPAGPQ